MQTPELKVLVIDDQPDNLIVVNALLKEAFPAARVLTAMSGLAGIELALAEDPDVILLDIVMSGMDGFEVCRWLKADARTKDTPVIFLTALQINREHRVKALEEGAEAFLSKPIDEIELAAQVRAMAKIKAAIVRKRDETKRLAALVSERTQEFEELGARQAVMIANISDVIAIIDQAGINRYKSPNLTRWFGWRPEEIVGTSTFDYIHPDEVARFQGVFANLLNAPRATLTSECRYRCRDNSYKWIELTAVNLASDPFINGILLNYRDITERKRSEDERAKLEGQLLMSQKMEAIGRLAGGVAHDFNNLLTVILSCAEFAIEALREGDPLHADLLDIKGAGERAEALTRQLLAFSRKQILQPVLLDLNKTVVEVEKMLRRILGEDISFVQILAPDLGLINADPGQIEQVLMNLAVNARDAMPEGGEIIIRTSNVEIGEERAARPAALGPYVLLTVTDTGSGMNAETKARLFEPFFTTKEEGKGTGLGLSTVYGIIEQSGGNISVYSEPDQGTTFQIYLPRELSAIAATITKAPVATTRSAGTETILVVEDEDALRTVVRRSLEAEGYTVLTAAAGDEAQQIVARHADQIHLLVTDVVMPRMSGRVLAEGLVRSWPSLKVLYMSGYTDDAIIHHGVLEAESHFIGKPFTGARLARKVREALDAGVDARG